MVFYLGPPPDPPPPYFAFFSLSSLSPMPSSPGQREYSPTPRGSPEESQLSGEMQEVEAGGPLKTKVGLLHPVYQLSSMGQTAQRMLARLDSLMLPHGRGIRGALSRMEAGVPRHEKTGGPLEEVCQQTNNDNAFGSGF